MNAVDAEPEPAREPETQPARVERCRPRVAWRAIIGILAVIGMAGGYWTMGRQKARMQQDAVERLRQSGAEVHLEYQWNGVEPVDGGQPPEAGWIRDLLGDAMFDRAVAVDLRPAQSLDGAVTSLRWLPYLQFLDARHTGLTDTLLVALGRLHGLQTLRLDGTPVSDQGLASLQHLIQLRELTLASTQLTDRSVSTLALLKRLRRLDLSATQVTADGVRQLRRSLPHCEIVATSQPVAAENR